MTDETKPDVCPFDRIKNDPSSVAGDKWWIDATVSRLSDLFNNSRYVPRGFVPDLLKEIRELLEDLAGFLRPPA